VSEASRINPRRTKIHRKAAGPSAKRWVSLGSPILQSAISFGGRDVRPDRPILYRLREPAAVPAPGRYPNRPTALSHRDEWIDCRESTIIRLQPATPKEISPMIVPNQKITGCLRPGWNHL